MDMSSTPTVRYTSPQKLFQELDRTLGDAVIITDVSPSQFTEILSERETLRRGFRFRSYHAHSGVLVVTIPTLLHEKLHLGLYEIYRDQLCQRFMSRRWDSKGATMFRATDSPAGGDGGEGDSGGGPIPERWGLDRWPTLVIEGGYSQSLNQLHTCMRRWFSLSNHEVEIVLLAKFNRGQRKIILQKWEEQGRPARMGATTTRRTPPLQPVLRQEIVISRDETTNPPSYHVARGALVLGFRALFLRDPGPQDDDFIISVPDLQWYSEQVWSAVYD